MDTFLAVYGKEDIANIMVREKRSIFIQIIHLAQFMTFAMF